MRLFLIPISTRRALIYARPLSKELSRDSTITDRITTKAAETWAKWEEADKGWRKHLVIWGNRVQQQIPFEEWGLKSIPALHAQRNLDSANHKKMVDVLFPGNAVRAQNVHSILQKTATERQDLHRKRMWWSFAIAPLTAPIGLIPLIPNIPFFYLAYRGWSHWRALNGSKHLEFLLQKNLLNLVPFTPIERLYTQRVSSVLKTISRQGQTSDTLGDLERSEDTLLLQMSDAKQLSTILDAPELALEAERAIIQVDHNLTERKVKDKEDSSKHHKVS